MKRVVITAAAALTLAVAAPAAPALAQAYEGGIHLKAEIPFEFVVNGETFPPGTYLVETPSDTVDSPVLTIQRHEDGEVEDLTFIDVLTVPAGESERGPRLEFERVGGLNFLDEVVPLHGKTRDVRH